MGTSSCHFPIQLVLPWRMESPASLSQVGIHILRIDFFKFQWTMFAPVFSEGEHLKLDFDVRLLFIETESIAYGGVHRVTIHSDHETFDRLRSPTQQKVSLGPPDIGW